MTSSPKEQAQPQPTITEQVHSLIVAVESLTVGMEAMQATIDHLIGADLEEADLKADDLETDDLEEADRETGDLEEIADSGEEAFAGDDAGDSEGDDEGNAFPSLESWVVQWFSPVMARRMGTQVCWCREWWQHAEAGSRLQALWWAWEEARLAPGGDTALGWWLKLDQALVILMGPTGPFAACTPDRHSPPKPLPVSMPPPDWLDPLPDDEGEYQGH